MNKRAEKARVLRLKKFYTIKGDGVAQLRLEDAASDPRFQKAIERLSRINIDAHHSSPENSPA